MIYVCNNCGRLINELNTPGDEVNKDLVCPECSKDLQELLKRAKQIQSALLHLFKRTA